MTNNEKPRKTVAVAGLGDLCKYFVEELVNSGRYNVVALSRAERDWFLNKPRLTLHVTDYSHNSILSILQRTEPIVLFSFLHSDEPEFYNTIHENFLSACAASSTCKRLVPSEYGGNIRDYPELPRFYAPTHGEFRKVLRAQNEVEWTLVNIGWFMDYFVPPEKTYMKPLPGVWPLDIGKGKAVVLGTGDDAIGWTAARDVSKALVALVEVDKWEMETYVAGEVSTWNEALRSVEQFHEHKISRRIKTMEEIQKEWKERQFDNTGIRKVTEMDEWNASGASAPPWTEVVRQRKMFFPSIRFRTITELLEDGQKDQIV